MPRFYGNTLSHYCVNNTAFHKNNYKSRYFDGIEPHCSHLLSLIGQYLLDNTFSIGIQIKRLLNGFFYHPSFSIFASKTFNKYRSIQHITIIYILLENQQIFENRREKKMKNLSNIFCYACCSTIRRLCRLLILSYLWTKRRRSKNHWYERYVNSRTYTLYIFINIRELDAIIQNILIKWTLYLFAKLLLVP